MDVTPSTDTQIPEESGVHPTTRNDQSASIIGLIAPASPRLEWDQGLFAVLDG